MSETHSGSCYCGAVVIEANGAPASMGYCHCGACRLYSGAPVGAFALWKAANVTVTRGAELLGRFKSSDFSERRYCTKCGGRVMVDHPGLGMVDISPATLPSFAFQPAVHLNYEETVLPMKDGLPKLKDFPAEIGGSGETMRNSRRAECVGQTDPVAFRPSSKFFESKPPARCIHPLDTMETTFPTPPPLPAPAVSNVRLWTILCHASALLGVFLHFPGHVLGPLIVWLAKRDDAPELDAHGKESLNFQLSMLLYNIVAAVFCLILIGFVFLAILWVLNAVFVIIASIQAGDGKFYRYPMTIRFIS